MKTREIYLDNNATTRVLPEVVDAMTRVMADGYGNPSSVHGAGARARAQLWEARERIAGTVSAKPEHVVFTSGASEANNLVLQSLLDGPLEGYRLVISVAEHSSILAAADTLECAGIEVIRLPVDRNGAVVEDALAESIDPDRTLVSIQWANNETGVVQPISRFVDRVHAARALFHTDAVQAVGKIPVDLTQVPVDFMSVSAHKVHGPLGVGAILARDRHLLRPLVFGGSQEYSLRPGTENLPGIVGFGLALQLRSARLDAVALLTCDMRDVFENALRRRGLVRAVNGAATERLPNTSSICFLDVDGEALTIRLDRAGVRCSQSSACTNQRPEPSYVLREMGLTEAEAYASVRFAFSEFNTMRDVEDTVDEISRIRLSLSRFAVA
ncbi:MAG: cysteine desulfurase family protein [Gemmatimonadota bacterium]|nr:cysteine desulfurase family protein [Gemmatimonadota bacterium]MDE2863513.1 cysteine desulfurase family protein [Gemmatimonadota bacterium]